MAHVTFIHGISNKPPADDLLRIWQRALADAADPLSLSDQGITSSMVYWADLMYAAPVEDLTAYEGVLENTAEAMDGGGRRHDPRAEKPGRSGFPGTDCDAQLTQMTDEELAPAAASRSP